ncbi:7TM diverse intracellular signaling domain-containing protein [Cytophagaceae bacterium ABcell3]|nr:7TM diverse intracellular signaling domain-containing protein [Cytophagaceae bacterium ABcell3]
MGLRHNYFHSFFIVLLLIGLFAGNANAIKPIVLSNDLQELFIVREYVEYMEDTAGVTLDEILSSEDLQNQFVPSTFQDLINQNRKAVYWLKFHIVKNDIDIQPFRIELFDYDIDEISFFYPDSTGKFVEHKAGFSMPFSSREVNHKNVSFILPSHIENDTLYMRFASDKRNVLEPVLRSYDRIFNYAINEYVLIGIFNGLLLVMILYNLLYFLSLRKLYYIYYVIYGSGTLLYLMCRNGTGFQYLWPNLPQINDYMGETGLFLSSIGMLLFSSSFLGLKRRLPIIYKILFVVLSIRVVIYVMQLFHHHFYLFELVDLGFMIAVLGVSLHLYYKGTYKPAKWLVISYSILLFSYLVSVLEQATFLSSGVITVYAVNFGIVLEFTFLSMGIAEMIKDTYKERNKAQANLIVQYKQNQELKEKVNRELEAKVAERTKALHEANRKMEEKAEENIKMSISLDLANNELKKYINNFAISTVTKSHIDFEDFRKAYPDEPSCMRYLKGLKDKIGYKCIKCGSVKSIKGKNRFDRRCAVCNYNESLTSNTIFHRIKFPLTKAFYMLYIYSRDIDVTASEMSGMLDLQKTTCQNFKNKVSERITLLTGKSKSKDFTWEDLIYGQQYQKS